MKINKHDLFLYDFIQGILQNPKFCKIQLFEHKGSILPPSYNRAHVCTCEISSESRCLPRD
jgi:hypothetical protein